MPDHIVIITCGTCGRTAAVPYPPYEVTDMRDPSSEDNQTWFFCGSTCVEAKIAELVPDSLPPASTRQVANLAAERRRLRGPEGLGRLGPSGPDGTVPARFPKDRLDD